MRATLPPFAAALALLPTVATTQGDPQAMTITEGLDYYCAAWMAANAGDAPEPRHTGGAAAGWREFRSAAPAVGPIVMKGGTWGQASVVRVAQADGHRCSIAIQLAADGWTTETAYAAVVAWTMNNLPNALMDKERAAGPRDTRETIWRGGDGLSVILQESREPGAQPNVFITLQRLREI